MIFDAASVCITAIPGTKKKDFPVGINSLCMSFAQLTCRESLRDIEACLRSSPDKLYHMGIRGRVSRSTLADANERHDRRIFADFASVIISRARGLYAGDSFGEELRLSAYALDSTTIDLCLSLFPWARFRQTKGVSRFTPAMCLTPKRS